MARPLTLQLEVRWGDAILEVASVDKKGRLDRVLASGLRVRLRPAGEGFQLELGDRALEVLPGLTYLDEDTGLAVRLLATERTPDVSRLPRLDSRLLHASMLAAAVQVCGISALLLAPPATDDPGGGFRVDEIKRYLRAPSGDAPSRGEGAVVRIGRRADETERPRPTPAAQGAAAVRRVERRMPTLAEALASIDRAVQGGAALGAELKQTIGDLARSTAHAPTQGAGMGGLLAPRDLVDVGAGSGLVGPGTSRVRELLAARRLLEDPPPPKVSVQDRQAPTVDHDDQDPSLRADTDAKALTPDLDPVVRDQLSRAIRRRVSNVRYCYETYGLQGDPRRTGRVVLEITLRPDGYVAQPSVRFEDKALGLVAECIERMAGEWYLGDGLVQEDVRLGFPFILQPRTYQIDGDPEYVN